MELKVITVIISHATVCDLEPVNHSLHLSNLAVEDPFY